MLFNVVRVYFKIYAENFTKKRLKLGGANGEILTKN